MPQVFRLVRERHAGHAYDGEGSRLHGGRWNPRGHRMVYTASSRALAVLELLVNAEWEDLMTAKFVFVPAAVPGGLIKAVTEVGALPVGWARYPAPPAAAKLGAAWLAAESSVALSVPSAVLPADCNYLLNPRHSRFTEVEVGGGEPFQFDLRLRPPAS